VDKEPQERPESLAELAERFQMPAEAVSRMVESEAGDPDRLTICHDCGIDAWAFEEDGEIVHEDFYVSNELWDAVCPDDDVVRWTTDDGTEFGQGRFVVCIGCFERRLGRPLTLRDLNSDDELDALSEARLAQLMEKGPSPSYPLPPSKRYLDRWRSLGMTS
jgi:hypothetical protein